MKRARGGMRVTRVAPRTGSTKKVGDLGAPPFHHSTPASASSAGSLHIYHLCNRSKSDWNAICAAPIGARPEGHSSSSRKARHTPTSTLRGVVGDVIHDWTTGHERLTGGRLTFHALYEDCSGCIIMGSGSMGGVSGYDFCCMILAKRNTGVFHRSG